MGQGQGDACKKTRMCSYPRHNDKRCLSCRAGGVCSKQTPHSLKRRASSIRHIRGKLTSLGRAGWLHSSSGSGDRCGIGSGEAASAERWLRRPRTEGCKMRTHTCIHRGLVHGRARPEAPRDEESFERFRAGERHVGLPVLEHLLEQRTHGSHRQESNESIERHIERDSNTYPRGHRIRARLFERHLDALEGGPLRLVHGHCPGEVQGDLTDTTDR